MPILNTLKHTFLLFLLWSSVLVGAEQNWKILKVEKKISNVPIIEQVKNHLSSIGTEENIDTTRLISLLKSNENECFELIAIGNGLLEQLIGGGYKDLTDNQKHFIFKYYDALIASDKIEYCRELELVESMINSKSISSLKFVFKLCTKALPVFIKNGIEETDEIRLTKVHKIYQRRLRHLQDNY